jgi:hypothetical protein
MLITTRLDPGAGLRVHVITGRLTYAEVRDTLEELYAGPDFDPTMNALWDMREAVTTDISSDDVRKVAQLVRGRPPIGVSSRVALVVSRDADFGMARMYEAQLDGASQSGLRVFRDIDEATAWVGGAPEGES